MDVEKEKKEKKLQRKHSWNDENRFNEILYPCQKSWLLVVDDVDVQNGIGKRLNMPSSALSFSKAKSVQPELVMICDRDMQFSAADVFDELFCSPQRQTVNLVQTKVTT